MKVTTVLWDVNELRKLQAWYNFRVDSKFTPSQWETALLCNDVSHWLGGSLESSLQLHSHGQLFTMMVSVCMPLPWASVHWLVQCTLEYHWLTQCTLGYHWATQRILAGYTGTPLEKLRLKQPHTGMPLEKLSLIRPTLGCHWKNSNFCSLH